MAPQSEWPQTMMCCTPRAITANSMAVDTPPFICPYGGTTLPTLRVTNRSPGELWVISSGMIRESAQVMNIARGFCS